MGGGKDLGPLGGGAQPVDQEVQSVGVQAVVDLLDRDERRRIRFVQCGQQGQKPHGAERCVCELDRLPDASLDELNGHRASSTAHGHELNVGQARRAMGDVANQRPPSVPITQPDAVEGVGKIARILDEGRPVGAGWKPSHGDVGFEYSDPGQELGELPDALTTLVVRQLGQGEAVRDSRRV